MTVHTTPPIWLPWEIVGRCYGIALRGGDLEGEEIIPPSSYLITYNLQYFNFLVSFHFYVRAYVNVIGTILFFHSSAKKIPPLWVTPNSREVDLPISPLPERWRYFPKGGGIPIKMRTHPAQSWFHPYHDLDLLWVLIHSLSLNVPMCSVSWQKCDEKTRVGSLFISKKNNKNQNILKRRVCLSRYLQLKKAGWVENNRYVSHVSVDISWTD